MMISKESIKDLILRNNRAVERAILAIYQRQTEDEKMVEETTHHNGIGFSGAHARLGTYYAKWILKGNALTGRHLEKARAMSLHYVGQLVDIANSRPIA